VYSYEVGWRVCREACISHAAAGRAAAARPTFIPTGRAPRGIDILSKDKRIQANGEFQQAEHGFACLLGLDLPAFGRHGYVGLIQLPPGHRVSACNERFWVEQIASRRSRRPFFYAQISDGDYRTTVSEKGKKQASQMKK
jgi:hypothetical protein